MHVLVADPLPASVMKANAMLYLMLNHLQFLFSIRFRDLICPFWSQIHDQQALLKANAMLCLMLKSSAVFSEERDAWMKGFGEMPVDVFARLTQHEDVIHRHASFCRSLKRILKNDHAAYVLVSCIVLFEPQAANVMDRQTVNVFQDK